MIGDDDFPVDREGPHLRHEALCCDLTADHRRLVVASLLDERPRQAVPNRDAPHGA